MTEIGEMTADMIEGAMMRVGEMTGGHLGTTGIGGMTGEGMIGTGEMTGAPLRVMTGTGEMIEGAMIGRGEMIEEVMTEIGEMTADMIVKEKMIEDMIRTEEITKVLTAVAEEMMGGMRVEEEETSV